MSKVVGEPMDSCFVVSADCHVLEPPDLWEKRIERKFRHRIPRLELDKNGRKWLVVEGKKGKELEIFLLTVKTVNVQKAVPLIVTRGPEICDAMESMPKSCTQIVDC